jgi:large subunit ribosomal protein L25
VLYGRGRETQSLTFNSLDLRNLIFSAQGSLSLASLNIEGKGEGEQDTIVAVKDYQVDPVRRELLHADLYEVDLDKPIQVEVPVNLTGTALGEEDGGLLQQVRRTLLVSALPQSIPGKIDVDISHLEKGQSIHVSAIQAVEGVEILTGATFTIATVVVPRGIEEEVAVEEELEGLEGEEVEEEAASDEEEQSSAEDQES